MLASINILPAGQTPFLDGLRCCKLHVFLGEKFLSDAGDHENCFRNVLEQQTDEVWAAALATLLSSVHESIVTQRKSGSRFIRCPASRALETDDREGSSANCFYRAITNSRPD